MTENAGDNEEKFVEFVRGAIHTHGYNDSTNPVPREEMWSAIVMARKNAAIARTRRRYLWAAAGMAATLVMGVAIGRFAGREEAPLPGTLVVFPGEGGSTAFDVATLAHLSRAEALIVSYTSPAQTSGKGSAVDSAMTRWAKDMLSNTRLLLDSPMATDVTRRRLLEDLERVLVQMVQVSPAETEADARAHVERSLERTRMRMRLRAVQSATPVSGS